MNRSSPKPLPDSPWIARLLPRRVRDRVFLPAYYDLLSEGARQGSRGVFGATRFGVSATVMAFESVVVGFAAAIGQLGRGTRRVLVILALTTLTLLGVAAIRSGDSGDDVPYVPRSSSLSSEPIGN